MANAYGESTEAPSDSEISEGDGGSMSDYPTAEVPVAAIGDKQEGDTVEMKVVSIDQDSGMATLQCNHEESEPMEGGSIKKASEAFGEM